MLVRVASWDLLSAPSGEALPTLDTKVIPASVRRRLNTFGRAAGVSAANKLEASPLIVFASRYGDAERSLSILNEIATGEDISPMNFSLSVHNAVPGLISIAWKLTEMQSVIAGGANSFAMGLTEAISLLKENPDKSVLLISVDFPLPDVFLKDEGTGKPAEICALLLDTKTENKADLILKAELLNGAINPSGNSLEDLADVLGSNKNEVIIGSDNFGWELIKYVAYN